MKTGISIVRPLRASTVRWTLAITAAVLAFVPGLQLGSVDANPLVKPDDQYTQKYRMGDCTFINEGEHPYWILKPGFQMVYEGEKEGYFARWIHSVTDETKVFNIPGVGEVVARGVDEKEYMDGELSETATAYYAICKETGDIYDFGDETDVHNPDGSITHEGAWSAGEPDEDGLAWPGVMIPGSFMLGARYFQQMADGYSMERAENMADGLTVTTPAGTFENCIKVFESNTIEDDFGATFKIYAPGVGLLGEGPLKLVTYGYNIEEVVLGRLPAEDIKLDRKISDEQAREIALAAVPGEIMDVAIERKLGGKRIVVEVIAKADQAETDVIIDMVTGEVLGVEK